MTSSDSSPSRNFMEMAAALDEPRRTAEARKHHAALVAAMNASHDGGEQDALSVLEAIAMLLGQVTGNFALPNRSGAIAFVAQRATLWADEVLETGRAARLKIVPDQAGGEVRQ